MKKKLSTIFTAVFILMACVFASACGDKYSKLKFEIQYAFSQEEGAEWYTAKDGEINANIGMEEGSLKMEDGRADLFVRVNVKGVKKKDVGRITISKSADTNNSVIFTSKNVKQNEVIAVGVKNIVKNTSLLIYENNSGKSESVKLRIFRELEEIDIKEDVVTAITLSGSGKSLDLNSVDNIQYLPLNETNQTGVSYKLEGIGYFSAGEFNTDNTSSGIAINSAGDKVTYGGRDLISLDGSSLAVSGNVDGFIEKLNRNYALKIRATSIYESDLENPNEKKSKSFYVYLVEGNESKPTVRFKSNTNNQTNVVDTIHLYQNSNNSFAGGVDYSRTIVTVEKTNVGAGSSIYDNDGVQIHTGAYLKYEPIFRVGNGDQKEYYTRYDLTKPEIVNGLEISQIGNDFEYYISLFRQKAQIQHIMVEFGLVGVDINRGSEDVDNRTKIKVVNSTLPSGIIFNNVEYDSSESTETVDIYSYEENDPNYAGYPLTFVATPTTYDGKNDATKETIRIKANNADFRLYNKQGQNMTASEGYYQVLSEELVFIKFISDKTDPSIDVETKNVPLVYDGKNITPAVDDYITITVPFNRIVTANSVNFYSAFDGTNLSNEIVDNGAFEFAQSNEDGKYTTLYVKANRNPGVTIAHETIVLSSSNENVKFNNGKSSIAFDEILPSEIVEETDYLIYKVKVKDTINTINSVFTLQVGDGLTYRIQAKNRILFDASSLKITANEVAKAYAGDNSTAVEHFNFAIANSADAQFTITDGNSSTGGIKEINLVSDNAGFDAKYFGNSVTYGWGNRILNSNSFKITSASANKTHIIKIKIDYYTRVQKGDDYEIVVDQNYEGNTVDHLIELAVYNPITAVSLSTSQEGNEITYVNDLYDSNIDVLFKAVGRNVTPTKEIYFWNAVSDITTIGEVNTLSLSVDGLDAKDETEKLLVIHHEGNNISNDSYTDMNLVGGVLEGKVSLSLKYSLGTSQFKLLFNANILGVDSAGSSGNIDINVTKIDSSKGLVLKGRHIENKGEVNKLYLTYMGKDTKEDTKEFDVEIQYNEDGGKQFKDLVYSLYEYRYDTDGTLLYEERISNNSNITIQENNGKFTVKAKNNGGKYRLEISTKDSWVGSRDNGQFRLTKSIEIEVGDGSRLYKYVVNNKEEFYYINKDTSAFYVLNDNINLGIIDSSDKIISGLTGGLDGAEHTIKYTLNNVKITAGNYGDVVSLITFANGAEIENINLDVSYDISGITGSINDKGLILSGFIGVAENSTTIDNVYLFVNENSKATYANSIKNITFGGLVGINSTSEITNCAVKFDDSMDINLVATATGGQVSIGGLVGQNSGNISGVYEGKQSLDTISFDAFVNMVVTLGDSNYSIGGIAGTSSGDIANVLVSGSMLARQTETATPVGYMSGIAGTSSGDIATSAVLALDISAIDKNTEDSYYDATAIDVSGVAGSSSGDLDNVKVVSVKLEYEKGKFVYGAISGCDVVAGLVANATAGNISNSSVENFVKDAKFYTLKGKNVYGLACGSATISKSFVLADITATGSVDVTTDSSNETDTYYIGKIDGRTIVTAGTKYTVIDDSDNKYGSIPTTIDIDSIKLSDTSVDLSTKANEYIPTSDEDNKYNYIYSLDDNKYTLYKGEKLVTGKTYYKIDAHSLYIRVGEEGNYSYLPIAELTEISGDQEVYELTYSDKPWSTTISAIISTSTDYATRYDINYVKMTSIEGSDFSKVHIYLPYLVDDNDSPLMILAPTDMTAVINAEYIKEIHSIYDGSYSYEDNTNNIAIDEMAIINYYDFVAGANSTEYANTWNLEDLIDLSIFPKDAQGGIRFEIIGSVLTPARIKMVDNKNTITFSGLSGNTPIIVKCYSIFNPDIVKYVAFYTELGVSELTINSARVEKVEGVDYDYKINLYSGDKAQLLNIGAINEVVDRDGYTYNAETIFSSTDLINSGMLSIDIPNKDDYENKINVLVSGYDVELKLIDDANFTNLETINVKIALKINAKYFNSDFDYFITVAETNLQVVLNKSATDMNVDVDHFDMYTNGNLNIKANLTTGFIDGEGGSENIDIVNNELVTIASDRDTIRVAFEQVGGSEKEFTRLMEKLGLTSEEIVKLFDFKVESVPLKNSEKQVGYTYNINLEMKKGFDYRYITEDIVFEMTILAGSNDSIFAKVTLTLKPTLLSTSRIENYNVIKFDPFSSYQNLVTNEYIENSIIAPGSAGSVMMLYLEPEYASVKNITISSEKVNVPSLGKDVFLRYTQYIYDPTLVTTQGMGGYLSYFGEDKTYQDPDSTELKLNLASRKVGNKVVYDGVIYIHVQLERFSGFETDINAYVDIELGNGDTRRLEKTLLTAYMPGASISYTGMQLSNGYMIQEDTFGNLADLTVYGYQFNTNPNTILTWYLPDGTNIFYSDKTALEISSELDFAVAASNYSELWYQDVNDLWRRANEYMPGTDYYTVNDAQRSKIEILRKQDSAISSSNFATKLAEYGELWYQDSGVWYNATEYVDSREYYYVTTESTDAASEVLDIYDYITIYLKNNYNEIQYNPTNDSYTMPIGFNVKKGIPAAFAIGAQMSVTAKDGQVESVNSDKIIFYPAKYILTGIYVSNLNNNNEFSISVSGSKYFDLKFSTVNTKADLSQEIYELLLGSMTTDEYKGLFTFEVENTKYSFLGYAVDNDTKENSYFEVIDINNNPENKFIIRGKAPVNTAVNFTLHVSYEINSFGQVELKFTNESGDHSTRWDESFALKVYSSQDEDSAIPIYTASDMFNSDGTTTMAEGQHYILMDNIDLTDIAISPITEKIASLDGNNKIIKIGKMLVDTENKTNANFGLFDSIGTYTVENDVYQTILKNVVVDYSYFDATSKQGLLSLTRNNITDITFGGLVGVNNGGLIYNCDVINTSLNTKEIKIVVDSASVEEGATTPVTPVNITFGGLVGVNSNYISGGNTYNGVITNSRVGRESIEIITPTLTGLSRSQALGSLRFEIGSSELVNDFNVLAGGFVGENNGTISSSFVMRTDLINYSTRENDSSFEDSTANMSNNNKTAGFVAKNSGDIHYSYVRGKNYSNAYYTGSEIRNAGNGAVAGFVHENTGNIDNAFANITLYTKSSYIAGFVYNNKGNISETYSACELNAGANTSDNTYAEQPFVGMNNENTSLSHGTIENSYYYITKGTNYELDKETPQASALNLSNFGQSKNLVGFDFVLSNSNEERRQGIWSYSTADNISRALPELMTANIIAHSCRFVMEGTEGEDIAYQYVTEFASGSENNPYIIRNVSEYENAFRPGDADSQYGYFRFINNITFKGDGVNADRPVVTKENYTLGTDKEVTSVEGNGMSISHILLETTEQSASGEKVGLFSSIKNSYVRNLNLNFVLDSTDDDAITSTTNVKYVGGLAGTIEDSVIINVNLNGNGITLAGNNFVGGLAGKITGQSVIYSITSNLGISVGTNNSSIYNSAGSSEDNMSYGGGLAGLIDIQKRNTVSNDAYNIAYIDIRGDQINPRVEGGIMAEFAGGIAGYGGNGVNALKLKYFMGKEDKIVGSRAAGGLFGVFMGDITASQVTKEEGEELVDNLNDATNQYEIDVAFGDYITMVANNNESEDLSLNNSDGRYGNLTLVQSNEFAGGLIGVGIRANIISSYSKASISKGITVGGLIGADFISSIGYSYGASYVELNNNMKYVGGLVGYTYLDEDDINTHSVSEVKLRSDLMTYLGQANIRVDEFSSYNYSFATLFTDVSKLETTLATVDYIVNYRIEDKKPSINKYVYYGSYTDKISAQRAGLEKQELKDLYDLESSVHETTFQEIFLTWTGIQYWTLDSSRFFPLLLNDEVSNTIKLDNTNFLQEIRNNPGGSFEVIEDINLSSYAFENWVFDDLFTGSIVGNRDEDGAEPIIYGMKLEADKDDSMGFFRETQDAHFSKLKILWGDGAGAAMNTNGKNITMISGFSCDDEDSEFINITVSTNYQGGDHTTFVGTSSTAPTATGFAGLIGYATDSNVVGCNVFGRANVTLTGGEAYFGGLIGTAKGNTDNTDTSGVARMAITSSNVGVNSDYDIDAYEVMPTEFNITIADGTRAYIGGLVATSENASIAGCNVAGSGYNTSYKQANINVTNNNQNEKTQYFGGAIAKIDSTHLGSIDTNINSIISVTNNNATMLVGGIVGLGSNNSDIIRSTAHNDYDVSTDTDKAIRSFRYGGIIAEATNIEIEQCLSYGSLDMEGSEADTGYIGGIVGMVNTSVSLTETMSHVDIIAKADKLFVGGLVGSTATTAGISILHSISSGRIVPIVTGEGEVDLAVGGLVGKLTNSDDTLSIKNTFTTSSIVLDSLSKGAVNSLYDGESSKVNALVGVDNRATKRDEDIQSVYYSSDYSLAADSNNYANAVNWTAQILIRATSHWADTLNVEDGKTVNVWGKFTNDGLPYISSLLAELSQHGLLGDNEYKQGTSLNPLSNYDTSYAGYYKYYLLADVPGSIGTLNGVMVFLDPNIIQNDYTGIKKDDLGQSLIPTVSSHSAVSNLHVVLTGSYTSSDSGGVLVKENKGMIYNSSVVGDNISVDRNITLGLIAGENAGMVMNCFSTAEIRSNNEAVGGIVYSIKDEGRIVSCYFTGYIGGNGAGIVYGSNATASDYYLHNNYMAGVIGGIVAGGNSLSGELFINQDCGSNNYIDALANSEAYDTSEENTIIYLNDITGNLETGTYNTTIDLIKNKSAVNSNDKLLFGQWHLITKADDTVDKDSHAYAKNYNYPIFKMNKVHTSGCIDNIYQTYTGNGGVTTAGDVIARKAALYNTRIVDYYNAIKIPHLGALQIISKIILDNSTGDVFDANYVIIYNLDGKYGTGSDESVYNPIADAKFKGVIISNMYYKYESDSPCTIANIASSSLLGEIHESYIGDFKIDGSFSGLADSGILGNKVVGNVVVDNIVKGDNIVKVSGSGNIGGLFGEIDQGTNTVTIGNGNVLDINITTGTNAGLIAGAMTAGVVKISNAAELTIGFGETGYKTDKSGGLVGKVTYGEIYGLDVSNDPTSYVKVNIRSGSRASTLGGIVGIVLGECKVRDIAVYYEYASTESPEATPAPASAVATTEKEYYANVFGGIVGESGDDVTNSTINITNTAILKNNEQSGETLTINWLTLALEDLHFYGLTVGIIGVKGSVLQYNFYIDSDIKYVQYNSKSLSEIEESRDKEGAGFLIGNISGIFILDQEVETGGEPEPSSIMTRAGGGEALTISTNNMANLGGVAGYCADNAKIAIKDAGTVREIILDGDMNVGGIFGKIESLTNNIFNRFEFNSQYYKGKDFFNNNKWAELKLSGGTNIGGLVGYIKDGINGDDIEINLINANPIKFLSYEIKDVTKDQVDATTSTINDNILVENVGGVVGKITGGISKAKLSTNQTILFDNSDSLFKYNTIRNSSGDQKTTVMPSNVGGLIGYATGKEGSLINIDSSVTLTNNKEIQGFENVGGLIGKMSYVNLTGQYTGGATPSVIDTGSSSNVISGINCVGGVVGFAETSTISNMKTANKLVGNANVGGLVGRAEFTKIVNNCVDIEKDEVNGNIRAVYFTRYGWLTDDTQVKFGVLGHFIPTNFGGLAGSVKRVNSIEDSTDFTTAISQNKIANIYIVSAQEGAAENGELNTPKTDGENILPTVSTNANFMYSPNTTNNFTATKLTELVKFKEMVSGFGSFIGSIDVLDGFVTDSGSEANIIDGDVDIKATLGVNVGTFYGYVGKWYGSGASETKKAGVVIKQISGSSGTIKIDGAYFVGSIIGSYGAIESKSEIKGITNATLGTNGTVLLQTREKGFYVGGFFGSIEGFVSEMTLDNSIPDSTDIKINLDNVYYCGGLVGRYVVSSLRSDDKSEFTGNLGQAMESAKDINCNTKGWEDDSLDQNFGGLIGLLKIKTKDSSSEINIDGLHWAPFTINTIENENYEDGESNTSASSSKYGMIELYAIAHYVNLDKISVVGTSEDSYHNVTATNPLNPNAQGWSKEYTGFKAIQRCISQTEGENVDPRIGDSIAVVYDAKNITHVATAENTQTLTSKPVSITTEGGTVTETRYKMRVGAGYSASSDEEEEAMNLGFDPAAAEIQKNSDDVYELYVYVPGDYIIFTIYAEEDGMPKLYSRVGIATPSEESINVTGKYQLYKFTGTNWDHVSSDDDLEITDEVTHNVNGSIEEIIHHFENATDNTFLWMKTYNIVDNLYDNNDVKYLAIVREVEGYRTMNNTKENIGNYHEMVAYAHRDTDDDKWEWKELKYFVSDQSEVEGNNEAYRSIKKYNSSTLGSSYRFYYADFPSDDVGHLPMYRIAVKNYLKGDKNYQGDAPANFETGGNSSTNFVYAHFTYDVMYSNKFSTATYNADGSLQKYGSDESLPYSGSIFDVGGRKSYSDSIKFEDSFWTTFTNVANAISKFCKDNWWIMFIGGFSGLLGVLIYSSIAGAIGGAILGEHLEMVYYEKFSQIMYLERERQTFGVLGSMGAMMVEYENGEVVLKTDDSYNNVEEGTFYGPYSTERPTNYHTAIVLTKDNENFIEVDKYDPGLTDNGNGIYTYDSVDYSSVDAYMYYEGKYWILKSLGEIRSTPIIKDAEKLNMPLSTSEGNRAYVYGSYIGGVYQFGNEATKYGYKDNIVTKSVDKYEYLGIEITGEIEKELHFVRSESQDKSLVGFEHMEGYKWIKQETNLALSGSVDSDYYVTFTKITEVSNWYYTYEDTDEDGNSITKYVYYEPSCTAYKTADPDHLLPSGATPQDADFGVSGKYTDYATAPNTLYIKLYYTSGIAFNNLQSAPELYEYTSDSTGSEFVVKKTAKYYRYENHGFIKDSDSGKYYYADKVGEDSTPLDLYDANGNYVETIASEEVNQTVIETYYTRGPKNNEDNYTYISLSEQFEIKTDGLYRRNSTYSINMDNTQAGGVGLVYNCTYLSIPTESLMANRYPTMANANFYTRYRYKIHSGGSLSDINMTTYKFSDTDGGTYVLYDSNVTDGSPNPGRVTKYVERVQCILGGSVREIYLGDNYTGKTTCGSIKIK